MLEAERARPGRRSKAQKLKPSALLRSAQRHGSPPILRLPLPLLRMIFELVKGSDLGEPLSRSEDWTRTCRLFYAICHPGSTSAQVLAAF